MPGIDECLLEAMRLPGARGAALVDWTSGLALGTVGESPGGDHETAATEAAELARLAAEHQCFTHTPHPPQPDGQHEQPADPGPHLSPGTHDPGGHHRDAVPEDPPLEDLIISNRDSYHVLRFVGSSFDSSVVLHLWLARSEGNLAMARIRLGEMAGRLVLG